MEDELGYGEPVRRPVPAPAIGLGEEAHVEEMKGRATDVRQAEHLAAERVADEAVGFGVLAQIPRSAGTLRLSFPVVEEEVAVGAGGVNVAAEELEDVAVRGGALPGAEEVRGGRDVRDARRLDGVEAGARGRRRSVDQRRIVDDGP